MIDKETGLMTGDEVAEAIKAARLERERKDAEKAKKFQEEARKAAELKKEKEAV